MGESSVMTWALRFVYGREQYNDLGTEVCIWERAV